MLISSFSLQLHDSPFQQISLVIQRKACDRVSLQPPLSQEPLTGFTQECRLQNFRKSVLGTGIPKGKFILEWCEALKNVILSGFHSALNSHKGEKREVAKDTGMAALETAGSKQHNCLVPKMGREHTHTHTARTRRDRVRIVAQHD